MKSRNIWRFIWIIGVYAILVLLLYLVVLYKVKWEDLDLNKYLYFYSCGHDLCTSDNKIDNYYNKLLCPNKICPYITYKKDNLVVLNNNDQYILYNYIDDKIVNDTYKEYHFINDNYIVVTNDKNMQGIIDYTGKVIVDFKYKEILSFVNDYVTYKENNKTGIAHKDNSVVVSPIHDDITLIDSKKYAFKDTGMDGYSIIKYGADKPMSNTTYDYIFYDKTVIFVVKDKKIDILDGNLTSKLLMKLDTYYSYKNKKEIETLNIHTKGNLLYFSVFSGNNDIYKEYIYDITNNKLYSI